MKSTLSHKSKHLTLVTAAFAVVLSFYTNCSNFSSTDSVGEYSSVSATGDCDLDRMNVYSAQVAPFFRQTTACSSCHVEGGTGLGAFASLNNSSSFAAFQGAGISKVAYMATNPSHKPPYTGAQNQPAVDAISAVWNKAETDHLACVTKTQNGGADESLLTSPKVAPSIYSSSKATQTLTWNLDNGADLDASVTRSISGRVTIDVKVLYTTLNGITSAAGYVFSNPTMTLKATGQQIIVEGLQFKINGTLISSQTTFVSLSKIVTGTDQTPLMVANANTLIQPISSNDTFQLYFTRIVSTSESGSSSVPLTPILTLSDTSTGALDLTHAMTVNTSIIRDSGVLKWCMTETATPPASAAAACANTMPNTSNGWFLTRPTQYTLQNATEGAHTVYLWVVNQDLVMNTTAGLQTITYDKTPPVAPTLGSVTPGSTQIADITASHPRESDVYAWCVHEQSAVITTPPNITLASSCWKWVDVGVKPTTVGFHDSGSRTVRIYVRDRAGNISAASNTVTVFNNAPEISFSQLTGGLISGQDPNDPNFHKPTGDALARAVFYRQCAACHSVPTQPGFLKLPLFDWTAIQTDAGNGVLNSRINDALSPMPNINGGLMSQKNATSSASGRNPKTAFESSSFKGRG